MKFTLSTLIFLLILIFCTAFDDELKREGKLRKACYGTQPARRVQTKKRLAALRELMTLEVKLETSPIDAYFITSSDEHQSVEIEEYDKRLEYISGFSGSSGAAIVTPTKAALWTDGRYHLQADDQLTCDWLLMREGHQGIPTKTQWLKKQFPHGGRIGVNPRIISEYTWNKMQNELKGSGLDLVALNVSLIDMIWPSEERGQRRSKDAFVWDILYAGKSYMKKINETRREIKKLGADAMVVTSLDEIAWLLNIRGRDIPFSPFVRSYLILDMHYVWLYVNSSQLTAKNVLRHLHSESPFYIMPNSIILRTYEDIWKDLPTYSQKYSKILIPSVCGYSEGASHAIYELVPSNYRLSKPSPIIFLKTIKNPTEIQGMREAHIKDGAAVCDCFSYIERRIDKGDVFKELDVVAALDQCRYEQSLSLGNSFRTIVGFGANGAEPHYEPTNNTNMQIFTNSTVVIDSGGQYYSGTTDITRTLHFGTPSHAQKIAYTRVLIGSIQLASLTFPSNTNMAVVDVMARTPLWEIGLDYVHGTGHGIGVFSSVHESPINIKFDSKTSSQQHFVRGQFLSNEPGYYNEGDFGIRLENVMEVVEKQWLHTYGHTFLGFKTITLVPYEPKLIEIGLLSTEQRKWLNHYNQQIRSLVGAELKKQNKMDGFYWMMEKTKHIPLYGHSNLIISHPLLICISNVLIFIKFSL